MEENQNIIQNTDQSYFSDPENAPVAVDHRDFVDFKMVTFSLGGRDYGIDIMYVKEISRVNEFTYVPNSPEFVRGVYNLRGEIISVMDLRTLFNLDKKVAKDGLDDLIVLQSEDFMAGVIVDSINRVVGVNSSKIQPPHPLFAEINISFIKGIVEAEDHLYLILDVEKILSSGSKQDDEDKKEDDKKVIQGDYKPVLPGMGVVKKQSAAAKCVEEPSTPVVAPSTPISLKSAPVVDKTMDAPTSEVSGSSPQNDSTQTGNSPFNFAFPGHNAVQDNTATGPLSPLHSQEVKIKPSNSDPSALDSGNRVQLLEKLTSKIGFYLSKVNMEWFEERYKEFANQPNIDENLFLEPFYSRDTGHLWNDVLIDEFISLLPNNEPSTFYALDAGCAAGHEAYSIISAINKKYSNTLVRLWAVDSDLVNISMAPTYVFDDAEVPISFKPFIESGKGGIKFQKNIIDQVLFEYHDIGHDDLYPEMDLIVARDLLSFVVPDNVDVMIDALVSKMKSGALLIVGDNEKIDNPQLKLVDNRLFTCYTKL